MIRIKLSNSGTLQDLPAMAWLARSLRERSLLSSWPKGLDPEQVAERAKNIYYVTVNSVKHLLPAVTFVVETDPESSVRPPHPLGNAKHISPTNYEGWYFELDTHYEDEDESVVSTQHMNHRIEPGPTERHQVSYSHLSDRDMAELLGCNRLLNFKDVPERLRGQVLPSGTDLIEEIQRRLSSRSR